MRRIFCCLDGDFLAGLLAFKFSLDGKLFGRGALGSGQRLIAGDDFRHGAINAHFFQIVFDSRCRGQIARRGAVDLGSLVEQLLILAHAHHGYFVRQGVIGFEQAIRALYLIFDHLRHQLGT